MKRYVLVVVRSVVGNSALFWAKGGHGYTCNLDLAELYTEEEAFRQHESRPETDWPVPYEVAVAKSETHVPHERLLHWGRVNQVPRRKDPYGAIPRGADELETTLTNRVKWLWPRRGQSSYYCEWLGDTIFELKQHRNAMGGT